MKYWMGKLLMSFIAVGVISGCSSTASNEVMPNDPFYAPIIPEMPAQKVREDGSIFQASMSNSLYSDAKARRVGDIITVILRENTTATKSATTTIEKESETSLDPVLGLGGTAINVKNPISGNAGSLQFELNSEDEFEGAAQANQSNFLNGNISVTVIQVLPNQNLVIRGEKWLTLNNGDEYIRVTGIVRPADINPANEVISTKVANARIQYSGKGAFAKSNERGWLGSFFNSDWWPF